MVLDSFRKQDIVFWFPALKYEVGKIKWLTIRICETNIFTIFVFLGTASSFIKIISS